MDIRSYSGVNFQKVNSFNYIDTKQYNNDDNVHTLKEIFTLPDAIKDGKNYQILIVFEGDVEIGKVVTDQNNNKQLVGGVYIPAKSVVTFSTQYLKKLLFADDFLGFKNTSSIDPNIKPNFNITIWIASPDPLV